MPFWPVIKMFITFIRELIADKKEELNFSSSEFNARKATLFFLVIGLCLTVTLLLYRLYNQSVELVAIKEAIITNEVRHDKDIKALISALKVLNGYIDGLPQQVKKSNPVPSDSGNSINKIEVRTEKATEKYLEEQKVIIPPPKEPDLTKDQKSKILKNFVENK